MGKTREKKQKIILPPELPPELLEDEIEVSDEDLQFLEENTDYAGFVSRLDTESITKHVTRVADVKEDTLEALYEKRLQKKAQQKEKGKNEIQVDPVDALPVKSLDGKLYYRTLSKTSKASEDGDGKDKDNAEKDGDEDVSLIKLNKAERRAKLKKSKKEAKKHGKDLAEEAEAVEETPQAAVLAEVKEDLTAEEVLENKRIKLAEIGMALLSDPETNIKSLKEMLETSKDENSKIVKLGLLSLLAVFKDIIPGYRIRLPTEKELEMKVSKEVKKMRFYESTLLKAYKAYLQKLIALEKQSVYNQVVMRCICTLLDAVPHFNFRDNLLVAVVRNISSPDEVVRRLCCSTIKSLFSNEGKHGGEVTVRAVRLIADHVKANDCQLHPDSIEVLLSLQFDEDLRKSDAKEEEDRTKNRKNKKRKNHEEPNQVQENERKKAKREMMSKMRQEVAADYKAATVALDPMERRKMQTETLAAVFETYFRILRHTMQSTVGSEEANATLTSGSFGPHPLLAPCLDGLGKFSHLLDLDYMGDLMTYLKRIASASNSVLGNSKQKESRSLSVSERLRCCVVAFKVMRNNLNALNVDLQDFFIQLYNIILEYRPGRDQGEVLAEALKIMLCDERHQDMAKAAAFVKRLATFSLCFGCAESMSALVTVKLLLLKNVKCRNLLENDAGGGSVSGSISKYQPYATDPNLSGALATVLWELNLLTKYYHPTVSTMATTISTMNNNASQNQVFLSLMSPQQAFAEFSLENEAKSEPSPPRRLNSKRRRESYAVESENVVAEIDMDELSNKLKEHFAVVRGIKEKERLRRELQRTESSLLLYQEYKKQNKNKKKPIKPKKKI
ncbi:PREDICTED: nucleolar complex protein 3 homolog [Tarenaya hassleriana]|uniref:nucleolar complex protein 3 homolog n=1 Tax=Tarenaya hassleriana TaxID=28532 RepID=UPI00053C2813|nr:PREDICTED: nucleolar complex protein 3 homolog [Tarenaya hassleriana]